MSILVNLATDRLQKLLEDEHAPAKSPEESLAIRKRFDLIDLPADVTGTSCSNCQFVDLDKDFCTHESIQLPVNSRMCCKEWDAPGTGRPWQQQTYESTSDLLRDRKSWLTRQLLEDANLAQRVRDQLSEDFPDFATEWVMNAEWEGPMDIPADQIDFSHENSWRASKEPDKVKKFESKIQSGYRKPVILVKTPGKDKYDVADGHHRTVAARNVGRPVYAYVAKVNSDKGDWDEMHAEQYKGTSKDQLAEPNTVNESVDQRVSELADLLEAHKYGCLMLELPASIKAKVKETRDKIDKDDLHETEKTEDGGHITVLHGLYGAEDRRAIPKLLKGFSPILAKFGKTSLFPATPERPFDVLKVDVDSVQLVALHRLIAAGRPHHQNFRDYCPHVTIAFLKPGRGEKYVGQGTLVHSEATLDQLVYANKTGSRMEYTLKPPLKEPKRIPEEALAELIQQDDKTAELASLLQEAIKDSKGRLHAPKTGTYGGKKFHGGEYIDTKKHGLDREAVLKDIEAAAKEASAEKKEKSKEPKPERRIEVEEPPKAKKEAPKEAPKEEEPETPAKKEHVDAEAEAAKKELAVWREAYKELLANNKAEAEKADQFGEESKRFAFLDEPKVARDLYALSYQKASKLSRNLQITQGRSPRHADRLTKALSVADNFIGAGTAIAATLSKGAVTIPKEALAPWATLAYAMLISPIEHVFKGRKKRFIAHPARFAAAAGKVVQDSVKNVAPEIQVDRRLAGLERLHRKGFGAFRDDGKPGKRGRKMGKHPIGAELPGGGRIIAYGDGTDDKGRKVAPPIEVGQARYTYRYVQYGDEAPRPVRVATAQQREARQAASVAQYKDTDESVQQLASLLEESRYDPDYTRLDPLEAEALRRAIDRHHEDSGWYPSILINTLAMLEDVEESIDAADAIYEQSPEPPKDAFQEVDEEPEEETKSSSLAEMATLTYVEEMRGNLKEVASAVESVSKAVEGIKATPSPAPIVIKGEKPRLKGRRFVRNEQGLIVGEEEYWKDE